jgi:TPR repeat protein
VGESKTEMIEGTLQKKDEVDVSGLVSLARFRKGRDYINALGYIPKNVWDGANAGDRKAQYFIGFSCTDVIGVDEALIWTQRAAEAGHPSAQNWLGINYFAGHVLGRDMVLGMKWLTLGAKADPRWQNRLLRQLLRAFMKRADRAKADRIVEAWKPTIYVAQS